MQSSPFPCPESQRSLCAGGCDDSGASGHRDDQTPTPSGRLRELPYTCEQLLLQGSIKRAMGIVFLPAGGSNEQLACYFVAINFICTEVRK